MKGDVVSMKKRVIFYITCICFFILCCQSTRCYSASITVKSKMYVTKEDFDKLFNNLFKVSFEDENQAERIYDNIKDTDAYKNRNNPQTYY